MVRRCSTEVFEDRPVEVVDHDGPLGGDHGDTRRCGCAWGFHRETADLPSMPRAPVVRVERLCHSTAVPPEDVDKGYSGWAGLAPSRWRRHPGQSHHSCNEVPSVAGPDEKNRRQRPHCRSLCSTAESVGAGRSSGAAP